MQSMLESAGDPGDDKPPPRPPGVHDQVEEQPTYSKMMAMLVEQAKGTVDEAKPEQKQRVAAFVTEVGKHKDKVLDLQQQLLKRLAELEKLEGSKITSESIHEGFNTSHVAKATPAATTARKTKKTKSTEKTTELLNPSSTSHADDNEELDSGSEADVEDTAPANPDPSLASPIPDRQIHCSKLGLKFAELPKNDYRAYFTFIADNPVVLAERETDGLLMRAFDLQYAGREAESRQSVHQALLLQYCRNLGRDGVQLFFKRVTTPGHNARKVFLDDVNERYNKLRVRAQEMAKEAADDQDGEDAERIQLHAVNPGQKISIIVPPPLAECGDDETKQSREVYESLPPNLQKALATGELEEVNEVLGRMPVPEAEEVVGKLSEGGMLSMEEGVVDATTEDGRKALEEYERMGREGLAAEDDGEGVPVGEPGEEVEGTEKLAVDEVD